MANTVQDFSSKSYYYQDTNYSDDLYQNRYDRLNSLDLHIKTEGAAPDFFKLEMALLKAHNAARARAEASAQEVDASHSKEAEVRTSINMSSMDSANSLLAKAQEIRHNNSKTMISSMPNGR